MCISHKSKELYKVGNYTLKLHTIITGKYIITDYLFNINVFYLPTRLTINSHVLNE